MAFPWGAAIGGILGLLDSGSSKPEKIETMKKELPKK